MQKLIIFVVSLTIILCTSQAWAYKCSQVPGSGPSLWWADRQQSYSMNEAGYQRLSDGSEFDAVGLSFETWNAVACSDLTFTEAAPSPQRLVGYDWKNVAQNENLIIWRHGNSSDPLDAWRHHGSSIAVTTTTFNSRTGELVDADIELNAADYVFTTCTPPQPGCAVVYDVQNTVTHEIGHMFGLDHPPLGQIGVTETTMYYRAPSGEIKKRNLDQDDIDGLCFIYPSGQECGRCYDVDVSDGPMPRFKQVAQSDGYGCACSTHALGVYDYVGCFLLFRLGLRRRYRFR